MLEPEKPFIDAEFEVVSGPYRAGDRHRARRSWTFTGRFDSAGFPLFYNKRLDVLWYLALAERGARWILVATVGALALAMIFASIGYATGRYH